MYIGFTMMCVQKKQKKYFLSVITLLDQSPKFNLINDALIIHRFEPPLDSQSWTGWICFQFSS